jgi:cell division protein ZapA
MASVELEIAARRYAIACRNGEEPHLRAVAAIVDAKAAEASAALGSLGEARQLMFAALLLADELKELREGAAPSPTLADPDPEVANALERLAERVERIAAGLENTPAKA